MRPPMRMIKFLRFTNPVRSVEIIQRLDIFPLSQLSAGERVANEATIRSLCKVAYLGNDAALCRVLGHFKIFVDTRDCGLAPHLMLDGYWEMWVTEAIADLIKPGMVAADIGANVGYFTLLMAELVGPAGRVHAFEPNPRLAGLLQSSVLANGVSNWVEINQVALNAENGRDMALVIPTGEPKNAHMVPLVDHLPEGAVRVPSVRLDSRIDWQAIEFAKIDVEGAEELVWAGMQGLLDNGRLRTVILEFSANRYAEPEAFLNLLTAPGFSLARVDLQHGIVEVDTAQLLASNPYEDIMLVLRR
jgi:FkbM family methyltransferase